VQKAVKELRRENAELHKALRRIAELGTQGRDGSLFSNILEEVEREARNALGQRHHLERGDSRA
jgi:hypothetical protein